MNIERAFNWLQGIPKASTRESGVYKLRPKVA